MKVEQCPLCSAPVPLSERKCSYCGAEFFVSSLAYLASYDFAGITKYLNKYKAALDEAPKDIEALVGMGLCYLALDQYVLASGFLDRAINVAPDNPRIYYYRALAQAGSRRLKTLPLSEIRGLEVLLTTALQLGADYPEVKIFLAMIKRDYYMANGLKVTLPDANTLLADVRGHSASKIELERLFACARVSATEVFSEPLSLI